MVRELTLSHKTRGRFLGCAKQALTWKQATMDSRLPKLCFLLFVLYATVRFSLFYPQLPELMESHFRADGTPNGWEHKQSFFLFFGAITLVDAALVFVVASLVRVLPVSLINLPNKRYWLEGEQREGTLAFVSAWFGWFGCAVYAVLLFAMNYAVQSNLHAEQRQNSSEVSYALFALLVFTVIWGLRFLLRFAKPGVEDSRGSA